MATNPKLPPDLEVVEARSKLACSACGSRDIQTYPQSWRSPIESEEDTADLMRWKLSGQIKARKSDGTAG